MDSGNGTPWLRSLLRIVLHEKVDQSEKSAEWARGNFQLLTIPSTLL